MRLSAHAKRGLCGIALALLVIYAGLICLRILYPVGHLRVVQYWSSEYAVDPALVGALIRAESRYRADAISPVGAIGLMQIMPETGAWIAERLGLPDFDSNDLFSPDLNLRLGTWYLASLLLRFEDPAIALAAYNAGPTRAEAWIQNPDAIFEGTARYVDRILRAVPVYRAYLAVPFLTRAIPQIPL